MIINIIYINKNNNYKCKTACFLAVLLLLFHPAAFSQSIDQISSKKGIKMNGSVNLSSINYTASGMDSRRDPFNWFATGNININLFGYDMPFSFSYSNAQFSYTQPFNQYRFMPQYKWAKAYLGASSMNFSNYTLAGHVFNGVGVELAPQKYRISAMYGRLRKAVPYDMQKPEQNDYASYKRMGYGLKFGYEQNGDVVELSFFRAKDDKNSIPFIPPTAEITPQENIAIEVSGTKRIGQRFSIDAGYAVSALNADIRSSEGKQNSSNGNFLSKLLKSQGNTRYFDAIRTAIGYNGNSYTLQLRYERVAPEYQSLGAYFINNDMENYTLAPNVRLLNNKLNINANIGLQRNNLDKQKASTTKRWVANTNVSYMPNERWNFSSGYSNFSTYTNVRPQTDPFFQNQLDTLNFYQVSQTFNNTASYMFGGKEKKHAFVFSNSYQRASDQATNRAEGSLSNFITSNLSYSYNILPKGTTLTSALNYYTNKMADLKTVYWGPTIALNQQLFNKTLRSGISVSYNTTQVNGQRGNSVFSTRWNANYSPKTTKKSGRHNLTLSVGYVNRLATAAQKGFKELTVNSGYTYSF